MGLTILFLSFKLKNYFPFIFTVMNLTKLTSSAQFAKWLMKII
jgi:hypothetical protein